jgi:thiol-disulfide isomerase/thioredoxin
VSPSTIRITAALAGLAGAGAVALAGVVVTSSGEGAGTAGTTGGTASVVSGLPAPGLSGADPVSGKPVRLADFRRKPVVVIVWASWCGECADGARAVALLGRKHGEAGVLGIDYADTARAAKRAYERWGWKHPSIGDPQGTLTARLGVTDLPAYIFLDRRHRMVDKIAGAANLRRLEVALRRATRAG